jgi:hypothetical protein
VFLAFRDLWGRRLDAPAFYGAWNYLEASRSIPGVLERNGFTVLPTPASGRVGVFRFQKYLHVGTFLSSGKLLHIYERRTSRIDRMTKALERRLEGIYGEEESWE